MKEILTIFSATTLIGACGTKTTKKTRETKNTICLETITDEIELSFNIKDTKSDVSMKTIINYDVFVQQINALHRTKLTANQIDFVCYKKLS